MAALQSADRSGLYGKHDENIRALVMEKDKLVEMGLGSTFSSCMDLLDSEICRLKEPECRVLGGQYMADRKMVKIYIPVQEYPHGNLIRELIGKQESTVQRIQTETSTHITIMDKGRVCYGRPRLRSEMSALGDDSDKGLDDGVSPIAIDDEDKGATFVTIEPDFTSEDYQRINDCLVKAAAAVKRAMLPELPSDAPCWTRAVDENVSGAASQSTEDKGSGENSANLESSQNKSGTALQYEQDAKILLNRLHKMWKEGEMCDVMLDLGTEQIPAHRVILASLSPYFKTLFSAPLGESLKQEGRRVELHELDVAEAKALVEFAYTGKLHMDSCSVQGVLSRASLLQLEQVKEAFADRLFDKLCPSNCVRISVFAHLHDLTALKQAADRMLVRDFLEVVEGGELLDVPFQPLLLPLLQNKAITNAFPVQICEVALSWLSHNMAERERHVEQIAQMLPLGRITPNIMEEIFMQKYKDLLQRPEFQDEIQEAKAIEQNPDDHVSTREEIHRDIHVTTASAVSSFALCFSVCHTFDNASASRIRAFQFCRAGDRYHKTSFSADDNRFLSSLLKVSNSILSIGGIGKIRHNYRTKSTAKFTGEKDVYVVEDENYNMFRKSKQGRHGRAFTSIDVSSGKESILPQMKFARMDLGTALYNGRVYAVGGGIMLHPDHCGGVDVDPNSVECFDMEGSACEWTTVKSMSNARHSTRAAVIENRLFAVGGGFCEINRCWPTSTMRLGSYNFRYGVQGSRQRASYNVSHTSLKVVEAYDHRTGQWTEMAPLQTARRGHGLVAYDQRLYCAGGYDGHESLNTVECYEPRMNRWYYVARCISPRHGGALGVVNGVLYAVGGNRNYDRLISGKPYATFPQFQRYNPWRDSWTSVDEPYWYASVTADKSCYCTSVVSLYWEGHETYGKTE